jgi:hypothetical protein
MNDCPKEMACLDRATIWEGLIDFCEELERDQIEAKVGRSDQDRPRAGDQNQGPSGAPAQISPPKKPKRLPAWWKNASKTVQKDWLRDHEGGSDAHRV